MAFQKGARAPRIVASVEYPEPTVVYLGPGHKFTECYVRVVASEIEGALVERLDSLEAYLERPSAVWRAVRLTILDASVVPEFVELPEDERGAFCRSTLAVAFRDVAEIRSSLPELRACGVQSFLPLKVPLDVLLSIIRLLTTGGTYLPAELVGTGGEAAPQGSVRKELPSGRLTRRELQVLQLLATGRQNKHIAAELRLSQHTVKLHIHNIISKLGVSNRTEAAARYLMDGPSRKAMAR